MGQDASTIEELPRFDLKILDTTKVISIQKNSDVPQQRIRMVFISDTHGFHKHLKVFMAGYVFFQLSVVAELIFSFVSECYPESFSVSGKGSTRARNSFEVQMMPVINSDFNEWLGTLPHKHKIVISGNHDYYLEPGEVEKNKTALSNATHYLEDSGVTIEGIKFWGTPWHIHRNSITRWANNYGVTDIEILEKWKLIPDDTDVLLTHFPPLGVCTDDEIGSSSLRNFVMNKVKPKLHAFGHNHAFYGASHYASEDIYFINSAQQVIGTKLRTPIVVDYYVLEKNVKIMTQ